MEAENLWLGEGRQALGILNVALVVTVLGGVVNARGTESVIIIVHAFIEVLSHQHHQSASVELFSDSTTIVALTNEVTQSRNRHLIRVLIDEDGQLLDGDTEISLVESVLDIPSKWAVQAALLNDGMEEAETE